MTPLLGMKNAQHVVERLLGTGSPVQSVLFYGIEGSGHDELAKRLAMGWLCSGAQKPCGECQACGASERERNPDFLLIEPQGASSIIRLAAICRDKLNPIEPPLQEFFRTPPLLSNTKVALIQNADRMNADAANALLKTLEEPHPYARLILTTGQVGHLLPTILSRCLAIACSLPEKGELQVEDWIEKLSLGAPGRAAEISANEGIYQKLMQFSASLETFSASQTLVASQEFRSLCDQLEKATDCGARSAQTEMMKTLATCFSMVGRPAWSRAAAEAHRRLIGNGSAALVFDALFSQILGDLVKV